jgi:hypothetical protein
MDDGKVDGKYVARFYPHVVLAATLFMMGLPWSPGLAAYQVTGTYATIGCMLFITAPAWVANALHIPDPFLAHIISSLRPPKPFRGATLHGRVIRGGVPALIKTDARPIALSRSLGMTITSHSSAPSP